MVHGLILFSGGLDSVIATHLLKAQGLSLKALHFVLPFYSGIGHTHQKVKTYAQALGVPLRIEEERDEFLGMIRDPKFGFGKNANPCMDCRIHRLQRARNIMDEEGASFLATGEVIGQRPMSQRLDCLHQIERRAGLQGILLRPLSAKLLPETIPEQNGLINREALLGISGRSRKEQLSYARQHRLSHATPAGGCVLTHADPARRYLELNSFTPDFNLTDFKLLAYGRHFRISPALKIIIARNDSENGILEHLQTEHDIIFYMADITGPLGMARGTASPGDVQRAASILARFSRARNDCEARVRVCGNGTEEVITITPATDEICERYRI